MSSNAEQADRRQDRVAAGAESVKESKRREDGPTLVYTDRTRRDAAVELLTAYKWPVALTAAALAAFLLYVGPSTAWAWVPPWVWASAAWFTAGLAIMAIPANWVYKRWFKRVEGVEILDLDPVAGSHRHLRVGWDKWDDVELLSPWGGTVTLNDLSRATINGRQGFEVMDFRVRSDNTPVCMPIWPGEAPGRQIKSYRLAFWRAKTKLSRKADQYDALRASHGEIAREVASNVVLAMIRTAEESGMPNGDKIQEAVDDVMDDLDAADPMRDAVEQQTPDDLDLDRDLSERKAEREPAAAPAGGYRSRLANDGGREQ